MSVGSFEWKFVNYTTQPLFVVGRADPALDLGWHASEELGSKGPSKQEGSSENRRPKALEAFRSRADVPGRKGFGDDTASVGFDGVCGWPQARCVLYLPNT